MSSRRGAPQPATVRGRTPLSDHLVRITLDRPDGLESTGVPDEWVDLTAPGQFQSRYYSVRSWDTESVVLDIVLHEHGLVTEWARGECVGDRVGIGQPKGSFDPPADAEWLILVGDLTALPAIARICAEATLPVSAAYVEAPAGTAQGYPDAPEGVRWLLPPAPGESALAEVVRGIDWPQGPGYFWMAGESAQMRDIRKHLRHDLDFAASHFDVMGYWSGSRGRRSRSVDPGPIYARGKALGKSDAEIWADYDQVREG